MTETNVIEPGSVWRDERGDVVVKSSYSDASAKGVLYYRGQRLHVLGLRRFLRDFTRTGRLAWPIPPLNNRPTTAGCREDVSLKASE